MNRNHRHIHISTVGSLASLALLMIVLASCSGKSHQVTTTRKDTTASVVTHVSQIFGTWEIVKVIGHPIQSPTLLGSAVKSPSLIGEKITYGPDSIQSKFGNLSKKPIYHLTTWTKSDLANAFPLVTADKTAEQLGLTKYLNPNEMVVIPGITFRSPKGSVVPEYDWEEPGAMLFIVNSNTMITIWAEDGLLMKRVDH